MYKAGYLNMSGFLFTFYILVFDSIPWTHSLAQGRSLGGTVVIGFLAFGKLFKLTSKPTVMRILFCFPSVHLHPSSHFTSRNRLTFSHQLLNFVKIIIILFHNRKWLREKSVSVRGFKWFKGSVCYTSHNFQASFRKI